MHRKFVAVAWCVAWMGCVSDESKQLLNIGTSEDAAMNTTLATGGTSKIPVIHEAGGQDSGSDEMPTCQAMLPETCNGRDDNCDGVVDDGFDEDGDGYSSCPVGRSIEEVDCDSSRSDVHPNHEELCDGLDNDCDGLWDEGLSGPCPAPQCEPGYPPRCPVGTACDPVEHKLCLEIKTCPSEVDNPPPCPPGDQNPDNDPAIGVECDPTCPIIGQSSCWLACGCAPDGVYRWLQGCTE